MLAVIVLDCADPSILESLLEDDRLPALNALRERGARLPLRSEGAALDGGVFQTLLTGVQPGKHGVHKYRRLVPGTYQYEIAAAAASPVPQLWQGLSEAGRRCCVFDVPKAFPSPDFNGKLVASWGSYSPAGKPDSAPADLYEEVVQRFGHHPQRVQKALPLTPKGYQRALQRLLKATRTRGDVCSWLLAHEEWDFFMTAFSESHVGAHQFWHLRDPAHPLYDHESARNCCDALERIYEAIDENIGRLLEALPRDAHVIVLTQQGVQHNYSGSHLLPQWLARREGRVPSRQWLTLADGLLPSAIRNAVRRRLPEHHANRLAQKKFPADGKVFLLPGSEYAALLRVNLRGREPEGIVAPEAYEATLDCLCADLLSLHNAKTREPVVAELRRTRRLYDGPCVDQLPDLVVCWKNDSPVEAITCPRVGLVRGGKRLFTDITHSMHTSDGLAFLAGPDVPHLEREVPRDIRDVTATLFGLAGVPAPAHLEGKCLVPLPNSGNSRISERQPAESSPKSASKSASKTSATLRQEDPGA